MSNEISSRRELLRNIAISATLGPLAAEAAQHVHHEVAEAKKAGPYKPRLLTPHELETLGALADVLIPGARKAGAAEFIDLLASNNQAFATAYTGGLSWLDREMERRSQTNFLKAQAAQRTALLDIIAYRKNEAAHPELAAGFQFLDLARRMCADAYFTSREGIAELGYLGNKGMAEFKVPQASIDYALKRSGLA